MLPARDDLTMTTRRSLAHLPTAPMARRRRLWTDSASTVRSLLGARLRAAGPGIHVLCAYQQHNLARASGYRSSTSDLHISVPVTQYYPGFPRPHCTATARLVTRESRRTSRDAVTRPTRAAQRCAGAAPGRPPRAAAGPTGAASSNLHLQPPPRAAQLTARQFSSSLSGFQTRRRRT